MTNEAQTETNNVQPAGDGDRTTPFSRVRSGGVSISLWRNLTKDGRPYYVADRPQLSYKDDADKWVNDARGYSSRQLKHLIRAAVLADIELSKLNFAASVATDGGDVSVN